MNILSTVGKHLRRSPYQSFAAILTMFVTFLLTGVFFLATLASIFILQYFESKPQITVFFSDKATREEAVSLQKSLEATGKTTTITYVSKDDALSLYKEQNKNDPLLLEMVTADILPASLEVSAKEPKLLQDLEQVIASATGVEEVVYQKDVVDSLIAWTNAIRLIGGGLALLLAIDSLLVIMTIISMKIALKREEMEILKLVGASLWYIRMPFVIEGGLYGVTGAALAWFTITVVLLWIQPLLLTFLGSIPSINALLADPSNTLFILSIAGFLGLLSLTGFLLGAIGSLVATGRYLKLE